MKLNISTPKGYDNLVARVNNLSTNSERQWGTMNATEMLVHCNNANQLILNSPPSSRGDSFKQNLMRIIFLHLPFSIPKNIQAPKPLRKKADSIPTESLDACKAEYLESIKTFKTYQFPKKMYHPVFGNLSAKEWGVATWIHLDHHLRQFGV